MLEIQSGFERTSWQPGEKASLEDWLAVLGGALGAMMATLDISIVNASQPTIIGEIGATPAEGTWISTSYLVAEVIVIPLCGWLTRLFGLKSLLLGATLLFTLFSVMCGSATSLPMLVIGRVGQGLTGGAMVPTALTIIASRLPPDKQPLGTALFGSAVILGPILGPLVGGWITEAYNWRYAFGVNVPICMVLSTLLVFGLRHRAVRWSELQDCDGLGIVGMSLGLGSLTMLLERGQAEQWLDSALIQNLAVLSLAGFVLFAAGQKLSTKPVLRMDILLDRKFGAVFAISFVMGAALYTTSYMIPQFLVNFAGDNAMESGVVVFWSGIPAILLVPLIPWLLRKMDARVGITLGLIAMAATCWLDSQLTAQSGDEAFVISQLFRGAGQIMALMFLNQAAISAVPPTLAGDASCLFNAARNLGGSVGLALLATLQEQRTQMHRWMMHSDFAPAQVQNFGGGMPGSTWHGSDPGLAIPQLLDLQVSREALVMAFNDQFLMLAVALALALPLTFLLRNSTRASAGLALH